MHSDAKDDGSKSHIHENVESLQKHPEEQKEDVVDFVNEIKAQAMINSYAEAGFVYEPTSGLYYDIKRYL